MARKRVALVTGSNKGIGLAVVRSLCKSFDGDVILCSRDQERGQRSVHQLESEGLQPKLRVLDIENVESIRDTRDYLVEKYGGLDVLVNNAAVAYVDEAAHPAVKCAKEVTGVNFFATASVCDILFPILKERARIVNVGSSAGMLMMLPDTDKRQRLSSPTLTRTDLQDLAHEYIGDVETGKLKENGWPLQPYPSYCVSKILIAALTWIQHREFKTDQRKDIVINVVHPGYVDTDMTSHTGVLTPDEGANQIVNCCLIPPGGSPRGQMIWWDGRVVNWKNDILNVIDAPRLSENPIPH